MEGEWLMTMNGATPAPRGGKAGEWIRAWFGRRGDHVRAWWLANPQKRGLAATGLILLVSNAVLATVLITSASNYMLDLSYYTRYTDASSVQYLQVPVPKTTYDKYRAMPHAVQSYTDAEYEAFCTGDTMWWIATQIKASLGWMPGDEAVVAAILSFVQDKYDGLRGLHYMFDPPTREYPKYPLETLVDRGGDCEDLAILFASLVASIGYRAILISIPGHMFTGVALPVAPAHNNGTVYYHDIGSTRFYTCECTSYWFNVGVIPGSSVVPWTVIEVTI
jgi:hypothetical protein